MAELKTIYPHIIWDIKNVTKNCERESPTFCIQDMKWNLKLKTNGEKDSDTRHQILLKRSARTSDCKDFMALTGCVKKGNDSSERQFSQSVFMKSTMGEYIVWEMKVSETHQNGKSSDIMIDDEHDVGKFWKEYDFICTFMPEGNWVPTEEAEVKPEEYNPCMASLRHDFGMLFNNQMMSDVILECGDRKIYAHRNILAARSKIFAAMFARDIKVSQEPLVKINDLEPAILEQLVRYMYSGDIPNLDVVTVNKVYDAAHKYVLPALKIKCSAFMVENMNDDNAPCAVVACDNDDRGGSAEEKIRSHLAHIKALPDTEKWNEPPKEETQVADISLQKLFINGLGRIFRFTVALYFYSKLLWFFIKT